ncbi:MAG: hypothetical protein ACLGI5_17860 [Thermoleophilia bacterium]
MPAGAGGANILSMPATPDMTRRALIEVAASGPITPKDPVVRRYRLARVALYTRPEPSLDRFAYLRRSHD